LEKAEAVQASLGFYLPQSEAGEVTAFEDADDKATQAILQGWSEPTMHDAAGLPLAEFMQAARAVAYDPARLSTRFQVPLDMVLRRLTHLPEDKDTPLMGLAVCDGAGVVTFQKPVLDFRLPRAGAACPLWPLYQALSQPGRVLHQTVRLPGVARTPFECFAVASPVGDVLYGVEPRIMATMLVRPARIDQGAGVVGPGCRVCPVSDCAARRHPSLL
jgi:predicted transcriptional regulator